MIALSLLAAAALTPVAYNIPVNKLLQYNVEVHFDGYIPLFGGQDGKVDVLLGVGVKGATPGPDGNPRVTAEPNSFKLIFNGAEMTQIGLDAVKAYFPKNTITMTPQGDVLKNDAPNVETPVKLPGLDVKRFPEITFLPIQFPPEGIEQGKEFTFKKSFSGTDVIYTVTPDSITEDTINLSVRLAQTFRNYEDEAKNQVKDVKDATAEVTTQVAGIGKAVFDRKRGVILSAGIDADATGDSIDLKSKASTKRSLKTKLVIKLRN